MDVGIATLRSELRQHLDRVRRGEEVVVTDRGVPVVRIVAVDSAPALEQLTREGAIAPPRRATRPRATGARRVSADGDVSGLVSEMRR